MARGMVLLCVAALGLTQAAAEAFCPSNPTGILCEDFNTYCNSGGFPGGAGVTKGTECPGGTPVEAGGVERLRQVWLPTSTNEFDGTPCGELVSLDTDVTQFTSVPYAGMFRSRDLELGPEGTDLPLSQQSLRDFVNSPLPTSSPGQILNFSHFIRNAYGSQYDLIAATDTNPLVLTFVLSCSADGKIWFNTGYLELAYSDDPTDSGSRANTDHVMSPNCSSHCSPPIGQGPFPIMCANGNPQGALPIGCPSTASAPQRTAIAVGALAMTDVDPCHCGVQVHGPAGYHLAIFDGKLWFSLRRNSPYPSSGTVTPLNGAPMPPPEDINDGTGDFGLVAARVNGNGFPYNWVTLTIKTSTMKVEHIGRQYSNLNGYEYEYSSVMDNIPRNYLGPFKALRAGTGPGCRLNSNSSWTDCAPGTGRSCIVQRGNQQRAIDFDDLSLSGGVGYNPNGACCRPDASCEDDTAQSACENAGGQWHGESSTCDSTYCCPVPYADTDHDGDVDQVDFGVLQSCITGAGGDLNETPDPDLCGCFNQDPDSDVDAFDMDAFLECWTGPTVEYDPENLPAGCNP